MLFVSELKEIEAQGRGEKEHKEKRAGREGWGHGKVRSVWNPEVTDEGNTLPTLQRAVK